MIQIERPRSTVELIKLIYGELPYEDAYNIVGDTLDSLVTMTMDAHDGRLDLSDVNSIINRTIHINHDFLPESSDIVRMYQLIIKSIHDLYEIFNEYDMVGKEIYVVKHSISSLFIEVKE